MFLLNTLQKLTEAQYYSDTYYYDEGLYTFFLIFFAVLLIMCLPFVILRIVSLWKIFQKAGKQGWESIVPVYSNWVLFELCGIPGWWCLILIVVACIPYIGSFLVLLFYIVVYINLAAKFKKDTGFIILLIFLPIVGLPMLAFGKDKYYANVAPVINLGNISNSTDNGYTEYKQNNSNNNINRNGKITCQCCGNIEESDSKFCSSCGKELK